MQCSLAGSRWLSLALCLDTEHRVAHSLSTLAGLTLTVFAN